MIVEWELEAKPGPVALIISRSGHYGVQPSSDPDQLSAT